MVEKMNDGESDKKSYSCILTIRIILSIDLLTESNQPVCLKTSLSSCRCVWLSLCLFDCLSFWLCPCPAFSLSVCVGGSGWGGVKRPSGSKFFQFHAVLGKIWQNRMLAPLEGWHPHLGEILDLPLVCVSVCQ